MLSILVIVAVEAERAGEAAQRAEVRRRRVRDELLDDGAVGA